MLQKISKAIERYLYTQGFCVPEVRKMAHQQVLILLGSLPVLLFGDVGVDFVSGVLLGSFNFLAMGKVVQELVYVQKGAVAVQLFSFYGRLVLTALALYLLIVVKGSSVVWVLLGVSTVLVNILLWGMTHFLGKTSKEA